MEPLERFDRIDTEKMPGSLRDALIAAARAGGRTLEETWIQAATWYLCDPREDELPARSAALGGCMTSRILRGSFRFADLLSGIGGFRLALERLGGTCVFACDSDPMARLAYEGWFGDAPEADLLQIPPEQVPTHDVLCAAFPSAPFTVGETVGKRSDPAAPRVLSLGEGRLLLRVCDVIRLHRPPVVILEAGGHLLDAAAHVEWEAVHDLLSRRLGYDVHAKVIDEGLYVPQQRRRTFIVGFSRRSHWGDAALFRFPCDPPVRPSLPTALEPIPAARLTLDDWESRRLGDELRRWAMGDAITFPVLVDPVSEPMRQAPELRSILRPEGLALFVAQAGGVRPRRLAPIEIARLAGFERRVTLPGDAYPADDVATRLLAEATVPAVARAIARQALGILDRMRRTAADRDMAEWEEKQRYKAERLRNRPAEVEQPCARSKPARTRTSRRGA